MVNKKTTPRPWYFDQIIILQRQVDVYIENISPLIDGLWEVMLEGQDWRLDSVIDGHLSEVI